MQSKVSFVSSQQILQALLMHDTMRHTAGSVHLQMLKEAIMA
jgi:hypothetical protein